MNVIPKNTYSSNFTDAFSSLGLCSLLKVAGIRKIAGYMVLLYHSYCFLFYHHVSMIQIKQFTVTIHTQRNLIPVLSGQFCADVFCQKRESTRRS